MDDAHGNVIGQAVVEVVADETPLDRAFGALPSKVGQQTAAVTHAINVSMTGVQQSTALSSYKIQQFGQTLDDLQYVGEQGLRPIINNLMQLSPALGVLALAADQVIRHWSQLSALAGDDTALQRAERSVEGLTARVKELRAEVEKAPTAGGIIELAGKEAQLRREKLAESADQALGKAESGASKAMRSAFEKAVGEYGFGPGEGRNKLATELATGAPTTFETQAQQQRIVAAEDELKRMKGGAALSYPGHAGPTSTEVEAQQAQQERIDELRSTLDLMRVDAARRQIDEAMDDPQKLRSLIPHVKDSSLRNALEAATPEGQERAAAEKLNDDELARLDKLAAKHKREREAGAKKAEREGEAEEKKAEAEYDREFEERRKQRVEEFNAGQKRMHDEPMRQVKVAQAELKLAELHEQLTGAAQAQFLGTDQYLKGIQSAAFTTDKMTKQEELLQKQVELEEKMLEELKKPSVAVLD